MRVFGVWEEEDERESTNRAVLAEPDPAGRGDELEAEEGGEVGVVGVSCFGGGVLGGGDDAVRGRQGLPAVFADVEHAVPVQGQRLASEGVEAAVGMRLLWGAL